MKRYNRTQYNGRMRATVQRSGRILFTGELARRIGMGVKGAVEFWHDDERFLLYMVVFDDRRDEGYEINHSGRYYYVSTDMLLDEFGLDYTSDDLVCDLLPRPEENETYGGAVYELLFRKKKALSKVAPLFDVRQVEQLRQRSRWLSQMASCVDEVLKQTGSERKWFYDFPLSEDEMGDCADIAVLSKTEGFLMSIWVTDIKMERTMVRRANRALADWPDMEVWVFNYETKRWHSNVRRAKGKCVSPTLGIDLPKWMKEKQDKIKLYE